MGDALIWHDNVDFDDFTLAGTGVYDGAIVISSLGVGCARAADFTHTATPDLIRYHRDGFEVTHNSSRFISRVLGSTGSDVQVRAKISIGTNTGGIGAQASLFIRRVDNSNYYFTLGSVGALATLYLEKLIGGVNTVLSSVAHSHVPGATLEMELQAAGTTITAREVSPDSVVTSAVDISLSAGGEWGIYHQTPFETAAYGIRSIDTRLSGTFETDTLDAGSSVPMDTLLVNMSLPAGTTGGIRVSGVDSGSGSFGATITLSDGQASEVFTSVTARYWQLQGSLGRGTSTPNPAFKDFIALAKGNNATAAAAAVAAQKSYLGEGQNRYIK